MLQKYFSIFIIFTILLSVYTVEALTVDEKGKILDNFKGKQQEILFENPIGEFDSDDFDVFDISKRMNIYGSIGDKIKNERGTIEDKSIYELGKILSLQQQLDLLEQDIEDSTTSVNNINANVIEVKKSIELNEKTLVLIRKNIADNRETLLKYLEYVYKKSNNVYNDDQFDNLKTILLNNENISDIINDLYFKSIIQITGKELIDNHKKMVAELYLKKLDLEKDEAQLKQLRKLAIIDRKVLSDKKEFKERLLVESQGKQELYENFIEDKLEVEKKLKLQEFTEKVRFQRVQRDILDKYGCEFIDLSIPENQLLDLDEKCSELNKVLYAEERLQKSVSYSNNFLEWPLSPKLGITSFYRDEEYKKLFGSYHDAIDVRAPQGTPITAPADGYVTFINPPDSLGYSFLALKHANGFVTVYGHLSEVNVQEFDYIRRGQTFAKTGGEYGTKGAGLITTGPHLHMEVFQGENSVDPLLHLDLSYVNYSNLRDKYHKKFAEDFRIRKGYDYAKAKQSGNVFTLNGNTEIERQKDLISRYASPAFQNWEMWVNESLTANIDPTFTMCIGLAESSLGRNITTQYNVGNVGNTDSGDRRAYSSPAEGVYAMIRTLNNRFLGGYNEIQLLSRYGNEDGLIYASSDFNWHNNIIKCMSAIKGFDVPDDYNFRLVQ